jgi:anti-sigma regulatory factor (Ser/Thr protein kinase)
MTLHDEIILKPTACDVVRLNAWLDKRFSESRISKSLAADLKLCLNEILANLISYGFKDTPDPLTRVEIILEESAARAIITDNGAYFDIREWKSPEQRDLMAPDPGGFGVNLIKERVKHIEYARVAGLNQLKILCGTPSS